MDLDRVAKLCFLVPPGADRRKGTLALLHGEIHEQTEDIQESDTPFLYFPKKERELIVQALTEIEVALRERRVFGASPVLANAVLSLAVASRGFGAPRTVLSIVSEVEEVPLRIFVGIPSVMVMLSPGGMSFFEDFTIGRFVIGPRVMVEHKCIFSDEENVQEVAKQGGFSPRVGAWITRETQSVRVLSMVFDPKMPTRQRDYYLYSLSGIFASEFKSDLDEDQRLPASLGAPVVLTDKLFSVHGLSIDIAFGDYARTRTTSVNFYADAIPNNVAQLGRLSEYVSRATSDMPIGSRKGIDTLLIAFSGFVSKAKLHSSHQRSSEAFIHLIFALDLVFGGKSESTKNTTFRTAAIIAASSSIEFHSSLQEIKQLYDIRSKYVHEGREVAAERFDYLADVCRMVTECLLKVRKDPRAVERDFVTNVWYKRLDYVVAAMNCGYRLDSQAYRQCGLEIAGSCGQSRVH